MCLSYLIAGISGIINTDNFYYPSYLTTFQSHFNTVRVGNRIGQDLFNDTPCPFVMSLVLFPDNIHDSTNAY
jgi:hypothetical protein